MATNANFITRTATYQELIADGRGYSVPPYQRDYSWSRPQWRNLWHDVIGMYFRNGRRHYMGPLVVESRSDGSQVVIDGQQRFATLSVLTLAVIDALRRLASSGVEVEKNSARADELLERFIRRRNPASLVETDRLRLSATDDRFYREHLVHLREPEDSGALSPSNKALWDCFGYFAEQIGQVDNFRQDGAALAGLISETVAWRLIFTLITVDDISDAYTIYETLNSGGLALTPTDLLKSHIIATASSEHRAVMRRRWHRIATTVGQARVPDLLRYHILCELPVVPRPKLYRLVRDRYRSARDVFELLEILETRSEFFAAVGDPSHQYWSETPEARRCLTELQLLRTTSMMPLLFAAWEKWSKEAFVLVLKLVCALAFRYTVVGRLSAGDLERAYHRASKAVMAGTAREVPDLFELLRPVYVSDEETVQAFTFLTLPTYGPRKRLAKHILMRLEEDASGNAGPGSLEDDSATIEHILPEHPDADWADVFPAALQERAVYRIGNLALLEVRLNREAGNGAYARKLAAYAKSRYALTKAICRIAPETWTPSHIDERQGRLAARAVRLWRADFA